jgi:hypothetical protein
LLAVRSAARFVSWKLPGGAVGLVDGMGAACAGSPLAASRARARAPVPVAFPSDLFLVLLVVIRKPMSFLDAALRLEWR